MEKNSKIYVAGHTGLIGSAVVRLLKNKGYRNILLKTHNELDLARQGTVERFFKAQKPRYVFLTAARVGGIRANVAYPAEFIFENIMIQSNVMQAAYRAGVKKLIFLGSACSYPVSAPQPMKEAYLLTGPVEPTNQAYAVAKIAGAITCKSYNTQYGTNFICAMPANTYGINDNFDPEDSHVIPALIRRFAEALKTGRKEMIVWGTGRAQREFIYCDDVADACIFLMENYNSSEIINIGTGKTVSIKELVYMLKDISGFRGRIVFDRKRPDGSIRKELNSGKINALGWRPAVALKDGLERTFGWYIRKGKS